MDPISGTNGNDNLSGTSGDDIIQGFNGNDTLSGLGGNDRLEGGRGDDTLTGGAGNDVFNFEQLQDNDVVTDFVRGQDKIDVRNLNINDWATLQLLISNDGQDNALITTFSSGSQSRIKLLNINPNLLQASDFIFNTVNLNQTIEGTNFADQLFGGLGNDTLRGFNGNDVLFGEQGDDRFEGGRGDDTFYGGAGNDVFNLEQLQDNDVVIDFVRGQDKIDVRNLNINDWTTLQLLISNDGQDNALITTFFNGSQSRIKLLNINPNLLQASDFIFNTVNLNQTIEGTNFADQLFGGLGNDTLRGFNGNDVLFGEQGDDRFEGGRGDDTFYGGAGNDVFNLEQLQDNDVVIDFVRGQDKIDVRNLNINDWTTLQLLISNDGQDNALITTFFNGSQSRIKLLNINPNLLQASDFIFNTVNLNQTIEGTNFADQLFGGLGNDTLRGFNGNDVLFGEQGDDRFEGGRGDDTFYSGAGNDVFNLEQLQDNDVVIDFVRGQDKIDLRSLNISDWSTLQTLISNDGQNNALITTFFNGSQSQIKLNNINPNLLQASDFIFNTNTVNNNETIDGTNFADQLFGGLGNDTLRGFNGNDVLFGEQGDDRFEGGAGNDTFYGGAGNDIAVYSGTRSQYQVTSSGGVFTVTDTVANRDGVDTLREVEQIQFSDQTITIGNTSPTITLAVSPASVTEDGTPNLIYTFTRTGSTTNALTVNYSVAGTATLNTDYAQSGATSFTATTGTITFAAGASTAILTINPTADTTVESNETVALTLATGTGYTVGTTTAVTGTITNDDTSPTGITINLSGSQTIVEGSTSPQNVTYTVTLSQASSQIITVQYATANGTATAGSDYTSTTGTLTFNPGETSKVINIPILNDSVNEANETFTLRLTSPTNATLGTTNTVTTTITDTLSASVTTTLPTNVENLTLTGTAAINGTGNAGNNVLTGNSGNNILSGGAGNDTYAFVANAALGTDTITETATGGIDTIDFSGSTGAVRVNLGVTTSQTVNSNLKLILSANNVIENATGGTGNDRLTGNALNNILAGGNGNDQLQGLAGNDTLWGGLGDDILTGGAGQDKYLFQSSGVFSSSLGVDYISQFDVGQDQIVLSKATFNAVTNSAGQALTDFAVVSDDEFVNASSARIVYSQGSGSLFYNRDGNVLGTGTVFEFARLGNPDITLSSSDFSLIA
ncbi:M10 family metallopeptidase C-terminal domain-containing protein [Trichormus variabilis]|uniref:M10 family metallopeptidase C-terminal domain-containing protein n=1 Tax=Anabaena variabilis TaxID=264691 RepID=UPI00131FAA45|nr:Calx-beta domain-containing protein [Trichormus variabilis]QHD82652.1 sodium:calcium exchanger [Trichormus variabilis 0441]